MRDSRQEKRGIKKRKEKRIIFLCVEGKTNKTEKIYFNHFNSVQDVYRVHFIQGNETDPLGMLKATKKELQQNGRKKNDLVFLVLDLDNNPSKAKTVLEAKKEADKFNIHIILSNPCFEVWFLEHFIKTSKYFEKSDNVISELKKHIPNYTKNMDVFPLLQNKTDVAIRNCRYLEERTNKKDTFDFIHKNPSTDIYQIIEIILNKE